MATLPRINIPGTGGTRTTTDTPFFNPDVITPEQYKVGGVDYFSQTLGTGVGVADPIDDEDTPEDTGPDIFNPIGSDGNETPSIFNDMSGQLASQFRGVVYDASDIDDNVVGQLTGATSYDMTANAFSGPDAAYQYDETGNLSSVRAMSDAERSSLGNFTSSRDRTDSKLGIESMLTGAGTTLQQMGQNIQKGAKNASFATALNALGQPPTAGNKAFGPGKTVMGLPPALGFLPFAAALPFGAAAARSSQAQHAAAYKAVGGTGGALMNIGGMSVSRAPGSFAYTGVLPNGWDTKAMMSYEAALKGKIPGTLTKENWNKDLGRYENDGIDDIITGDDIINSKGTFNDKGYWVTPTGSVSAGTISKQTDSYTDAVNRSVVGVTTTEGGRVSGNRFSFTKAEVLEAAKATRGKTTFGFVPGRTGLASVVPGQYLPSGTPTMQQALQAIHQGKIRDAYGDDALDAGTGTGRGRTGFSGVASYSPTADYSYKGEGDEDSGDSSPAASAPAPDMGIGQDGPDRGGDTGGSSSSSSSSSSSGSSSGSSSSSSSSSGPSDTDSTGGRAWASGGRVGMQQGGPAGFAERPEFVGGNQQPTDQQSIADDVPREVQEGTFVINSAAADEMGRDDVEKMIREAYQKAGESGMGAGQQGISQEVAIAVSRGEVTIPPHIAKIIGYDRLKKINNRGKKEVSRRQQEREQAAKGGFISKRK